MVDLPGDYRIRVSRPGWRTEEKLVTVSAAAASTQVPGINLLFGDLNGELYIERSDLLAYAQLYGQAPSGHSDWDVAGEDGQVTLLDLAIVARNCP